jgi:dTDP-4-dehydrorhamnose 3,5-epimerase-like enzyme
MAPLLTLSASEELRAKFGADVEVIPFEPNVDSRGTLVEFDFASIPFPVRRAFAVSDVPGGVSRGGHAHREAEQLLVCLTGCVAVELRAGDRTQEVELKPGTGGLHIGPGVWASQRYVEEGSTLLVLASTPFDPAGYDTDH